MAPRLNTDSHVGSSGAIVTIAMVMLNNARTMNRAIESVRSQTFVNWRLILIVSLSADDTLSVANEFAREDSRLHLIYRDEVYSWANGSFLALSLRDSEYFMFLDADDFITELYLEHAVQVLENENVAACSGMLILSNDSGASELPNISSRKIFKFASSKRRFVRVFGYCLTPECFGAVNLLYALWNRRQLENTINWTKECDSVNFDWSFVLNSLIKAPIHHEKMIQIVRENSKHYSAAAVKIENWNKISKMQLHHIFWYLLISRPPIGEYLSVAKNEGLFLKTQLYFIVFLRASLSILERPLQVLRDFLRYHLTKGRI